MFSVASPPVKLSPPQAALPPQQERVARAPRAIPVVVPPRPIKQVMPNTRLFGLSNYHEPSRVEVQVKIDETGRVRDAVLLNDGSRVSQLLLGQVLAAAKQWAFEPAKVNGRTVPSSHTIVFNFGPHGQ